VHRTLILIKPDGVARNLVGECLASFEKAGLHITALKMMTMSRELAEVFYAVHHERPFYNELITYITSGPIVAGILEGVGAIRRSRRVMGDTDPNEAAPGTIRFAYGETIRRNTVHGSDSEESAIREIEIIFGEDPT
jgi:nucleoside-diphosphate kinase